MARALYTLPRFNINLVTLIITQASPHVAPVLSLDPFLLGKKNCNAGSDWDIEIVVALFPKVQILTELVHVCHIIQIVYLNMNFLSLCLVKISTLQCDRSG